MNPNFNTGQPPAYNPITFKEPITTDESKIGDAVSNPGPAVGGSAIMAK